MKRASYILCLAAALVAACGEQTRNGQLTLTGSAPLRVADQSGKAVDFAAGPTKVEFSASGSDKFTVKISQGDQRQATFSGKAPATGDDPWNFTVRGADIGQSFDLTSARNVAYTGQPWTELSDGGPCGYNGHWLVENEYQNCTEDWSVAFADSASARALGSFRSHLDDRCLLSSQQLDCEGQVQPIPYPVPVPPRRAVSQAQDAVRKLGDQVQDGVHFD